MSRPRAALLFFLAGGLWLALGRLVADDRLPLTVHVPSGASAAEVERLIEEAVMVEVGHGLGWVDDPLMRDRAARIAADASTSQDPIAFATALDLPRRDPLMRARLVERVRRLTPSPPEPSDAELAELLPRFASPAAITFEHRFTRDPARANSLLIDDRGEAELTLGPRPTRTEVELSRALSPGAAAQIASAPLGQWTLLTSPLGHHAIRIVAHDQAHTPSLARLRPQLRAAWRAERRELMASRALTTLRERFDVELVTLPTPLSSAAR